jgi:MEMO1 family protein
MDYIKRSLIAGSWYPGNPRILEKDIQHYFNEAPDTPIRGQILGLVAPHAGYVYSGQVAAHAYKQIKGETYEVVFVIGPSHRSYFRGVSLFNQGGYETPLGIVRVHQAIAERLLEEDPRISFLPEVHMQEHSVEIQLPFLQVALGDFLFVPLMMGDQDEETCRALAEAIVSCSGDKKILVVGSSDLSHFHSYEQALAMDKRILDHLGKMDERGLLRDLEKGTGEACGGGPAAVTLMVAKQLGADKAVVLKYANSGDVTGDKSGVVGYAAAVFYKGERR